MGRPAAEGEIVRRWAGKALDFDPGTRWQYSNTNYVIAAAIVERVSGMGFFEFLRRRVFTPLGMTSVADFDAGPLTATDAAPLLRHGLGPLRAAPKEGRGWLFGAAGLAMTAHDLALWDIAVMDRTLLRPESWRAMQTDMLLTAGTATGYGLGVSIGTPGGRRRIAHGGAVSGYTTANQVYPDERTAIVVFTNIYPGAAGAPGQIAGRIAAILFPPADTAADAAEALARRLYDMLARGTVDRTVLSPNADAYFTDEALADYAASLGPLGPPREFERDGASDRGGMRIRSYRIRAGGRTMALTMMVLPDGKLDQYIVERVN
jgi:CubicO group peptidase (beta-lactamase class C family)